MAPTPESNASTSTVVRGLVEKGWEQKWSVVWESRRTTELLGFTGTVIWQVGLEAWQLYWSPSKVSKTKETLQHLQFSGNGQSMTACTFAGPGLRCPFGSPTMYLSCSPAKIHCQHKICLLETTSCAAAAGQTLSDFMFWERSWEK